ncbi:twin-arginine translocase subunit TatC [Vogesella sp. LYT5W]|uniref:Sec-independent protein translocase protein TatC n=1 Tax=Vogesella margarita TaxID=2984199 RepID=A0ABT5IS66_9NEIS|nr:twin-arginine translocase subunit TatC [Vogesella margarita]MDC7715374.1 twin-arginine translocase subunit TatC [Vogesella margarita]
MSDQQPLLAHLIELRSRVVRITLGILVCFLALFHWSGNIYHLLAKPMLDVLPAGTNMIATDVTAPFFVPVKVTMLVAFLLSLPNTMYQIWAFVAPGLYNHEKRLILPLVISSVLLFFVGMAFAYFAVFPVVFGFMSAVTPEGVSMMTDIDKYLSFVLGMFVAFGVTFEVPIVVIVLHRMGVVSLAQLREGRPYVIVAAFVIAAVVTPPDVLSQIMMALPLWLLYEAGILMAVLTGRQAEASHD